MALHDHLHALASTSTGTTTSTTPTSGGGTRTPPATLTAFTGAVRSGGAAVSFVLRSTQDCTGTLSGQTINAYAAAQHTRHRVSLGTTYFTLKAGKARTVVLKLSRSVQKLLVGQRSLKTQITITLTSAGNRRTVTHRSITLRALPKR